MSMHTKPVMKDGVTITFNYDSYLHWNPLDSNFNQARLVQAYHMGITAGDIRNHSLQQVDILDSFFDYYQYFRCDNWQATWIPKYNSSQAFGNAVLVDSFDNVQFAPNPAGSGGFPYTQARATSIGDVEIYGRQAELLMVQDKDDLVVRDNNYDEYLLQRSNPKAHCFSPYSGATIRFDPTMMDVISGGFSGEVLDGNVDQNYKNQTILSGGVTNSYNAPQSQNAGAGMLSITAPEANKWRCTKVTGNVNNQNQPLVPNFSETMLGWKLYIYTPFNNQSTSIDQSIGMWRIQSTLTFREIDSRAYITFASLSETEEQKKTLNQMRKLKGEHYLLEPKHNEAQLGARPTRQQQKRILENIGEQPAKDTAASTLAQDKEEMIKKPKPAGPSPTDASQRTPAAPTARTPFGRLATK